ncbi:hypothetical protein APR04_003959 [Promicromonospora umidemergens]|uniref:Uncharacterized protein n=1 Tax=Promicromonospora umidemergens TaxID=629679 RepID=A0ABP8X5N6_9MICO|nr:hypothetical protein [Promicromonospora umidemergens]MCP2285032.1 hypothetical protein [Promicromonospora umidemergens]
MSGHDDLGFDADLGHGRDVLKQTIGALVDGAAPSGVPSTPEENLGLLRRRVRTWRIAKAGAVGLTSAVVVGVLAFSTAQASTWTRSEPLPGRPTVQSTERGPAPSEIPTTRMSPSPTASASPSPSPSPSSTPEATPSGAASVDPTPEVSASPAETEEPVDLITAPFDDGYQPWGDAYPVWCGMQDEDLVSTSPSVSIEIVGDLTYEGGEDGPRSVPVRLTGEMPGYVEPGSEGATETIGNEALLIWSQGGRVVDLGQSWREGNYEIPPALNDTGEWTGEAYASSYSTCVEADSSGDGMFYDNVRAAGTYQVRAVQVHNIGDPGASTNEEYLVISDPVTVTVP